MVIYAIHMLISPVGIATEAAGQICPDAHQWDSNLKNGSNFHHQNLLRCFLKLVWIILIAVSNENQTDRPPPHTHTLYIYSAIQLITTEKNRRGATNWETSFNKLKNASNNVIFFFFNNFD